MLLCGLLQAIPCRRVHSQRELELPRREPSISNHSHTSVTSNISRYGSVEGATRFAPLLCPMGPWARRPLGAYSLP
ncbi:hypothetical protein M752DRAFT_13372 [Aspergillus phoenicis ATCC 13157]|uniref:Uncharacterized protein n=2 Tax=Aspergillus TaxID=5052 RepID=A0A1L9UQU9_ASPBC|nr:hypothetical protein ASPBRDRAFT_528037 [Aspergillus brasiliensis CBS 101740]RDK48290.1 hypothetical protein M752DRAFT_13372 [Aspergillus phoenicis ATCC 13157]